MTSDNKFSHLKQTLRSRRIYTDPTTGEPLPRQLRADQLHPHPLNPKYHPETQHQAVAGSLDTLGQIDGITINIRNGMIVDGHERAWLALGYSDSTMLDVDYVDLTEAEHELALAVYDETGRLAQYDRGGLELLLQAVNTDNEALQTMLAGMAEVQGLYFGDAPVIAEDMGAQIDRADELQAKWQVARGDVWIIGKHRLLCGDSTNADDVALVMDGDKADVLINDPPYGMRLDADFSEMRSKPQFATEKAAYGGRKYDNVIGDHSDYDASPIRELFSGVKEQFWFGADYYSSTLGDTMHGGSWLVWDKRLDETMDKMYGSCFELIWSSQGHKRDILRIRWAGIFGVEQEPDKQRYHPNHKPVQLYAELLTRYSDDNAIIADCYGGSGSLMVACEQLSRQCRMIEISEKYCAVILERMSALGCTPYKQ